MSSARIHSNKINYMNHDFVSVDLHPKNNKNLKELGNEANESDLFPIWNNYYFENPDEHLIGVFPSTITMEQIGVNISSFKHMSYNSGDIHHNNAPISASSVFLLPQQQQQQLIPPPTPIQQQQPSPPIQQQLIQQQPIQQQQQPPEATPPPIQQQPPPVQQQQPPPPPIQHYSILQKQQKKTKQIFITPKNQKKHYFGNMTDNTQGNKVDRNENNIKPQVQSQQHNQNSGNQFYPPQQPPQFQQFAYQQQPQFAPLYQPPQYQQPVQQYNAPPPPPPPPPS